MKNQTNRNLIRSVSILGLALLGWGWSYGAASGQTVTPGVAGQAEAAVSKLAGPASKALAEIKLTASDGAADDHFGGSLSLSSDGNTAIVGAANNATAAGADAGSACVYVRSGTSWIEQAKLTASDGAADDYFGYSVSLSSDGNTALAGAFQKTVAGHAAQGSAYVYVRSGNSWIEQAELTASDGAAEDAFGCSVSLSSDGNTALVGAYCDNTAAGVDAGSAYVFVRSGTSWSQQKKLTASDGAASDIFGWSVGLSSDGNTALVGALYKAVGANAYQGSAYVFVRSGSSWSEQKKLTASDGAASDYFGWSVGLSSDGNTALVGVPYHDTAAGVDAGSAYLFARSGGSWSEQKKLTASDGAAGDQFGVSVSLSSDGNTALVGAPVDDTPAGEGAGSAYIFVRSGNSWSQQAKLTASDGAASDLFGGSVSLSSNGNAALVGAYGDDTAAGADAGSAYVFELDRTLTVSASPGNGGTVSGAGTFALGSVVTVTARPESGFAFANWTENGTVVSHDFSCTFTLDSDRDLVANFASGSYVPVKGTYTGLFYESGAVAQNRSGTFTVNTTARSALSGSLQLGATRYSFSGKLDGSGTFTKTLMRGKVSLYTVFVEVDPTDADRVLGYITPADGSWTAYLEGDRAVFSRTTNPASQAGKYTMIFPGTLGSATEPGGYSFGTVAVDAAGKVRLAGSLADGTTISQSGTLSKNGEWPLYVGLYSKKGSLLGWITFGGRIGSALGGDLNWIKPPIKTAKYYPDGFTVQKGAWGSGYSAPAKGTSILGSSAAQIVLSGGGLTQELDYYVTVSSNSRVTSTNQAKLTFTLSTGAFKGSVPNPVGGRIKTFSFSGVVLPLQHGAAGYFLGLGQSGQVSLDY